MLFLVVEAGSSFRLLDAWLVGAGGMEESPVGGLLGWRMALPR